jgi:hypothetical protein
MQKVLGRIIIAVVLVVIAYWLTSVVFRYCHSVSQENKLKTEKEKLATETRIQTEKSIAEMAKRNNAIVNWQNAFDTNELSTYTIEVQDALIKTDNRPVIFFAPVEDIVKETTKYSVHFYNPFSSFSPVIYFVLDCTPEQIGKIISHRSDLYENYAVIAQISEVKKVRFEVKGYAEIYEEVQLELEQSDVFVATGKCLELLPVGDYEP